MNYPIMHLQHNSISVARQYIETSQQYKMETTKIVSSMQLYSQSDKHVSRIAASAINNDRRSRSGRDRRWFGRLQSIKRVSPASPASPDVFSITGHTDHPAGRHSRVRINHAPATSVSVWTMHRPYWLHRPYTVYMAVLYTKQ